MDAPFLEHLNWRLKCTIVIMRCPSPVVRPSVRPSSLTFHIFDFSSYTTERNSTKLYRQLGLTVPYRVCVFRVDRKNKITAMGSYWLRHFPLLLWTEFNENLQEARYQRPLPSFFFGADQKNKMAALASDQLRHFRLLLWNHWTEFSKTWHEARSYNDLYHVCVFWPIWKSRWLPRSLIGWYIFYFDLLWNCLTEFNETLPIWFFRGGAIKKKENKTVALAHPSKRWHIVPRCTICDPLGLLFLQ